MTPMNPAPRVESFDGNPETYAERVARNLAKLRCSADDRSWGGLRREAEILADAVALADAEPNPLRGAKQRLMPIRLVTLFAAAVLVLSAVTAWLR